MLRQHLVRNVSLLKSPHLYAASQVRFYGVRHKVVDIEDAVNVVKNHDTLVISGFVAQSSPEALLRALGERYERTKSPSNIRILFGGGPGDWATKGINHLAHQGMIKTAIGAHYGQIPQLAKLVLENHFAGYAVPMGAVSRMVRATASKSPGYITNVGLGTFVDPRLAGGALNEKAKNLPIVELINLDGHQYLRYLTFPINVAFIRATTADPEGNLSLEDESILGDAKIMAMAARSSHGIVVAQVKRLAQSGSIPSRNVSIPGTFVDCVVVADKEEEHTVSYFTKSNPVWTGEIREPSENIKPMPLSPRKIIARRAAMELNADDVVNLGIGIPEGVASIASEEGIFQYVTLTTEAGTIGGVGAGGHDFGPAVNPQAFNEMNQQFDLYNGGGLSVAFLGLAECGGLGDVNVSRLSEDSLTGPGGFIDIASCTQRVNFLGTFTKKGCKMAIKVDPQTKKPKVVVKSEGQLKTFKKAVREITFAAKEAIAAGQRVLYITERAVFQLGQNGIRLLEIAPGIDLQKDILNQMEIVPEYTEPIKLMDDRIFQEKVMDLYSDMFNLGRQLDQRLHYEKASNVVFLNLSNFVLFREHDLIDFEKFLDARLAVYMKDNGGKKLNMIINYDGFDCKSQLTNRWAEMAQRVQAKYYADVKRYSGHVFMRQKMGSMLHVQSDDDFWGKWTNGATTLTRQALVDILTNVLHISSTPELVGHLMNHKMAIGRSEFDGLISRINKYRSTSRVPKKTS